MSDLTDRLIAIFEASQPKKVPDPNAPPYTNTAGGPLGGIVEARYPIGTVFVRAFGKPHHYHDAAAIIVRTRKHECMLICLPSGNRLSDGDAFPVLPDQKGPTIEEFHRAFGTEWNVSRRGKEALAEWARDDV